MSRLDILASKANTIGGGANAVHHCTKNNGVLNGMHWGLWHKRLSLLLNQLN